MVCQICSIPANLVVQGLPGDWCAEHVWEGRLRRALSLALEQAQVNLSADDPKSCCASYHRGEIASLTWVGSIIPSLRFKGPWDRREENGI